MHHANTKQQFSLILPDYETISEQIHGIYGVAALKLTNLAKTTTPITRRQTQRHSQNHGLSLKCSQKKFIYRRRDLQVHW